ncbi:MAG TPA: GNAT family protein [Arachidicoccus sp.]|nr:GNAT family protein [Arachidicoccus sp.]
MRFQNNEQYILEDEFLQLRPLRMLDLDLLLRYALDEPELWQYNAYGAEGKDRMKSYIQRALTAKALGQQYPFIVFHKKTERYIGCTRYYAISQENDSLEIGYTWYGSKFQGTGINKNCKYLMLQFAFEQMQVQRVGFKASIHNQRSRNALLSIGCKSEGVLRNHGADAAGNRIDMMVFSIIRPEWLDGLKDELWEKTLKAQ